MLRAFGWRRSFGLPEAGDYVGVWGRKPVSKRGFWVAKWRNSPVLSFEDGFLRSVKTGREGATGCSLIADDLGIYFETSKNNRLQQMILNAGTASAPDLARAEDGIDFLAQNHLSKYNDFPIDTPDLPNEFVLVIDQTVEDASIVGSSAGKTEFAEMLRAALDENPDLPVVVKSHPETSAGKRAGYLAPDRTEPRLMFLDFPVSPWTLFERARRVYCVSSQLGMEAIFAGHRPVVFGHAFYAGWGLSDDRHPDAKPIANRSAAQLFLAAYIHYCHWFDPCLQSPSAFEPVARTLAVQADAARWADGPVICHGMRLWKRGFIRRYLGGASRFIENIDQAVDMAHEEGARILVWAGKATDDLTKKCRSSKVALVRVEDGFLRSSGLGAKLVRPMSLTFDDLGIYYDPSCESRLERLIAASVDLPSYELKRALELRTAYVAAGLSKYNLKGALPVLAPKPGQKTILVPGQVEDDASILKGAGTVASNLDLLAETRALFPDAYLVYKPHPDVQAGLRVGSVATDTALSLVDMVSEDADIAGLIGQVDAISTITSLTGFEGLLRGKEVICFGAPFYAGWGLTNDRGPIPLRRAKGSDLAGLIHATLIGYPRYWDPVTGLPCTVETILERLLNHEFGQGSGRILGLLAKAQGMFASYAYLWR